MGEPEGGADVGTRQGDEEGLAEGGQERQRKAETDGAPVAHEKFVKFHRGG
jgi:hypothetical protein